MSLAQMFLVNFFDPAVWKKTIQCWLPRIKMLHLYKVGYDKNEMMMLIFNFKYNYLYKTSVGFLQSFFFYTAEYYNNFNFYKTFICNVIKKNVLINVYWKL